MIFMPPSPNTRTETTPPLTWHLIPVAGVDGASSVHPANELGATTEVPAAPADADKRLQEEYGAAAIAEMQTRKDEAQFILLTPEDIDNDELVDLLERTPAYKRKPDDKTAIREKRQAAATQAAKAAEQASKAATPKKPGTSATINFGSD